MMNNCPATKAAKTATKAAKRPASHNLWRPSAETLGIREGRQTPLGGLRMKHWEFHEHRQVGGLRMKHWEFVSSAEDRQGRQVAGKLAAFGGSMVAAKGVGTSGPLARPSRRGTRASACRRPLGSAKDGPHHLKSE